MSRIKYLHCVQRITPSIQRALEEVPRRAGMFNWLFLFKGTIIPINIITPDILEDYDVIQINMAPVDQPMIHKVRKMLPKSSSTLIIGNNDYTCESWELWGVTPQYYEHAQDICDAVFGTEPYQTSFLRDDAFVIPHPCWTKMMKHIGTDDLEMDRFKVGYNFHWWEAKSYAANIIFDKLKIKYPKLITRIYGYNPVHDKMKQWQKVMWDDIKDPMSYPSFLRSLMTNRFLFENCSYHTYGRTSVDTACLGVPTVGSNRIMSMRHCFPNMSFDPFDAKSIVECMDKILQGGSWLDEQMDYASEAVEYFNYDNSKERYLKMYDYAKDNRK